MNRIKYSELNESSVENWCKFWGEYKSMPLNQSEMGVLVKVMMVQDEIDLDKELRAELEKDFLSAMLIKRMKLFEFELTNSAIIVISDWSKSPGMITMYLAYLQWYCYTHNEWTLDAKKLCYVFPCGHLSDDDMHSLWDRQKIDPIHEGRVMGPDNMLDYSIVYSSIRKVKIAGKTTK